ncbi:TetR/AcrR family transcriptional regulator [Blastococcus saxobsidens]|uniref:TetR/AcrR family transcriptional regulator n=1 Tax=Blastococcus saxobsidens TaxID=138336 RepID=UPI0031F2EE9C
MTTAVRPSAARERLLRAASATFYAEGIRGVGVDRVIGEAGVTRATFYRHFPGKDDLVVAYLEAVDVGVRERVGAAPTTANAAAGFLRGLAGGIGDELCRRAFRGCPFINAAAEFPDATHPVHRAVLAHRRWLEDVVRHGFAAAGHPDPAEATRRFVMLRDGAMVAGYLADPGTARTTLLAAVDDLLAAT